MSATTPPSSSPGAAADIQLGRGPLAHYRDGTDMDPSSAPRPYLHPVRTPAGTVVTDVLPADHPHHMGVSLAVPDVDGTQYWGGMSFVDGKGYVWLDNEGTQRVASRSASENEVREKLEWRRPDGTLQVVEERVISTRPAGDGCYVLSWRSTLIGVEDLSIGSPATNGRAGAEYGGLFWRFPGWPDAQVVVDDGAGESVAHGSTSRWLAISSATAGAGVILVQRGGVLPWFVRTEEYLGACPALAWRHRLEMAAGRPLQIGLDALVADTAFTCAADVDDVLGLAGIDPANPEGE